VSAPENGPADMIRCVRDVAYAPEHGARGRLDLWEPEGEGRPIAVVIHGGGLTEFSKERMSGIARFLARQGSAVANINYRLLQDAPYPASLTDTLAAIEWVQAGHDPYLARQDRSRVLLIGASAGGFLALTAGVLLGERRVRGIVSISGPALPGRYGAEGPHRCGHGGDDPRLFMAPAELVGAGAPPGTEPPPTLLLHSRNDRLVHPDEATTLARVMADAGRPAELYLFDGPGALHGIWREEGPSPRLFEHLEQRIAAFCRGEASGGEIRDEGQRSLGDASPLRP